MFKATTKKSKTRVVLVATSFILYSTLFFVLIDSTGKVSALALVPIITTAFLFGLKPGFAASILLIVVNGLFFYLGGKDGLDIMLSNIPGAAGSVILGAAAGYMSDLVRRSGSQLKQLEEEISERKRAEEKIAELQKLLNLSLSDSDEPDIDGTGNTSITSLTKKEQFNFTDKSFRELADNSSDMIYTIDRNGYPTYANKALLEELGLTLPEFTAINFLELIADKHKEKVKRFYMRQWLSMRKTTYLEIPLIRKDGSIEWCGQHVTLIFDDNKPVGFNAIARDISHRKEMEISIHENEERLRLITDTAIDAIVTCDKNFKITQWNKAAERMYGYSDEEIVGKPLYQLLPFIDREIFLQQTGRQNILDYDRVKNKTLKKRGMRKDGTVFGVEITIAEWTRDNRKYYTHIIRDITERNNYEKAIIQERDTAKKYLDVSPVLIAVLDSKGDIELINKTGCKLLGYKENEILGKNWFDLCIKESIRNQVENVFQSIISGTSRTYDHYENTVLTKEGDEKLLSFHNIILRDKQSKISGILVSGLDITEQRRAQNLLKESEERYRILFEESNVIMLIIDPESGRITACNNAAEYFYGYDKTELTGLTIDELEKNQKSDILSSLTETGNPYEITGKHIIKNGTVKNVIINPVLTKIGENNLILASISDITDRVKAEKELNEYRLHLENLVEKRTNKLNEVNKSLLEKIEKITEAEKKILDQMKFFRTLIKTIPIPVYIRDQHKNFIECNTAFENFFGLKKDELAHKSFSDFYPKNLAEKYDEMDNVLLRSNGKEKFNFETEILDKEGNIRSVIIYIAPYKNKLGDTEGTIGVILDITQQKNLQDQIKKSLEREKELSNLRSSFISTVSHEFRTPLTAILSSSDLINVFLKQNNAEKVDTHLSRIQKAVDYMIELIEDVLTMNKAETGRQIFHPRAINLNELVEETIENAKLFSDNKHKFIFENELEEYTHYLDKKLLTQILSNLLTNAVKYSPAGGEIKLKITKEDSNLKFSVSDSGIGINDEDKKYIFDTFFRSKETENIPGTGLGLSIVKKALELHQGEIYLENSNNGCTTFTFTLPLESSRQLV